MEELPDCDVLFARFFARWYSDADRKRRAYSATRPDMEEFEAGSPGLDSLLTDEWQAKSRERLEAILEAARLDWRDDFGVSGEPSVEWIEVFDRRYDRETVRKVIESSDPEDFANRVVVLCCEFGALLGDVLVRANGELEWTYEWPYLESALVHRARGLRINTFHWAIKKFSEYGLDDNFKAKVGCCLEEIAKAPSTFGASGCEVQEG